ncbi:MAG: TetR/AcrR family transcriptional regulator [Propionibacteriaceae bacterium]|nr:TetR/AcrR family transcriptional regulator [Propionibacteriaceae bacterium]
MPTPRDLAHAEQRARILAVAREHLVREGAASLSLRKVIAEVGMVSSAIYRYFPTRDALLTALIVDGYGELADTLAGVPAGEPRARFRALAVALLEWARTHPQEFALIYGTPVSGYHAPQDTIGPATRVVLPFLEAAVTGGATAPGKVAGALLSQAQDLVDALELEVEPVRIVGVVEAFTLLVGSLILHLGGHYVGTFEPFDWLAERIAETAVALAGFDSPR